MPTTVQFRRGTTSQNNSFTGAAGEISVDTDLNVLRVHDNATAGGQALVGTTATQTLTNKTLTSPTINSATIAMGTNKITGLGDPTSAQDAATKAYIDSELSSLSSNSLTQGDTNWTITDSGTGSIVATVDNTTHSTFAAAGITLSQGNFVGNLTGNASGSAATLATARAIQISGAVTGTANFDGSAAINIVTTNTADPTITLTGAVTGSGTLTNLGDVSIATTNTADPTITLTGAVTGSGTLTNLGDVSIATTNTADPTITLAGDLSGSATLTNLGSATLTATIAANSVALGTDTTGNYVGAGATSGNGISGSVSSEGGTFTVTSNATNANTGSTIVFRDGSGNFSAGVITATTTAARYADLAERYTADSDYESGTVLVFGGEAEVTQCTSKYDKRIAGIVSTDPAFLMNESLEDGVSVGLVGRLPCKVVGEVRKGDLMVSSDTAGHAEAWRDESNPPAGSVIGKALENKTGAGADVIEVVVGKI
jgi:hypothetical protein